MSDGFRVRLFPNRNVTLLFLGQLISQIGDGLYVIGLMWLVLEATGSKAAMGLVAMISYLPTLLFGVLAGVVIDLRDRRKIMMASDVLRAATVLVLAYGVWRNAATLELILVASFALASFATLFNPARDALLPELVARERLLHANALVRVSNYAAILLGPALGAVLLTRFGLAHLFMFDAASFLVSFLTLLLLRTQTRARVKMSGALWRGHFMEVVRDLHHDRRLRFLLALTALNNFFIMGPAIVGTPVFVKEVLREGAASYALVESALGFGMLLGAFLVKWLSNYMNRGRILLAGMMLDGLTYALVYYCRSLEMLMARIALHALAIPMIVVPRTALIQEWVAPERRGRAFSLISMAVVGMTALSNAATGALAKRWGSAAIFRAFGVLATLCGVVGWGYQKLRAA